MKKIIIGLFVFVFLTIGSTVHASFLGDTFQKIGSLTTQLKSKLRASLYYSSSDDYSRTTSGNSSYGISSFSNNLEIIDTTSSNKIPTDIVSPIKLPVPSICEPLSTNIEGNDKVNILFIPANTTEDKLDYFKDKLLTHAEVFYKTEPFKSNKSLLNFYFLRSNEIQYKDDFIPIGDFKEKVAKLAEVNCSYKISVYAIVVDANIQVFSELGSGIFLASIGIGENTTFPTIHEFGHAFAGLIDTYSPIYRFDGTSNLANLGGPNIDLKGGCSEWCQSNTGPYKDNCNQITDGSTCKMFNRIPNPYGGDGGVCKSGDCCVWLNNNAVDPFFKSRCVDLIGYTNIGESCLAGTGCYYGAYSSGEWRPTEGFFTIMSGGGTKYDPVSVRTIDLKIKCCYPQKGDIQPSECKEYSEKYPAFKGCYTPPSEIIEPPIPTETIDPVPPTEITRPARSYYNLSFTNLFSGIANFFRTR